MKLVRFRGYVIGWQTRTGRKFLFDALTDRAIKRSKEDR